MDNIAAEVITNCVYMAIALLVGDLLINNIFKKMLKLCMEAFNHINFKDLQFKIKKV